jgi:D-psicose/D-tagatose/L-ribulose 3-epimerase
MKLAVSNIAWTREEEPEAATLLHGLGLSEIEIAPTKAWDKPLEASDSEIADYRKWWRERGFSIVALQSLNYGQAHFQIFREAALRDEMLEYLKRITVIGSKLGARVMVFGSPKNRLVGDLPSDEAMAIAREFFGALGQVAADHGATFCIEPNPRDYGCDFVTDTASGVELVKSVNHPGFGLHLDAAGLTLAGDDPAKVIPEALPYLRHFHLSESFLGEVGPGKVDHEAIAKALANGYNKTLSIEMRPGDPDSNLPRTRRAVEFSRLTYMV